MTAGTRREVPWTCRVEAEVAAPVEAVWAVVADPTRTGEWSHECHEVAWLDGADGARPGARFRGANKAAVWRWQRTCEVLEVEAGRSITWRTVPTWRYVDSTEWRITVEPVGPRTRIVQAYEVVRCPAWWAWLIARMVPPHLDRSAGLRADLERIGEVAAADAGV